LESLNFVACRRRHLRSNICPESVFSFAVSRTRRGTDFSEVFPANQVVSARHTCSSRCTAIPSFFGFLNHPKRSSTDVAILVQSRSRKQIQFSVSEPLFRRLVFRRVSPAPPCSVFHHFGFIPLRALSPYSTRRDTPSFVTQFFAIVDQSRDQQLSCFQLASVQYSVNLGPRPYLACIMFSFTTRAKSYRFCSLFLHSTS
jgi:hypothetical protein